MSRIKASSNSLIICCFLLIITVLSIPHGVSSRQLTNFPEGFGRRRTLYKGQSCIKGSIPGHAGSSNTCAPPNLAVVQMTPPSPNSAISFKQNNTGNGSQKVTNNSPGVSVQIVNNKGNGKQSVTNNGNGSRNAHNKVGRRLNQNGDDDHSKTGLKGSDTGHGGSATGGDDPPSGVEQMPPPTSGTETVYVATPSSPSPPSGTGTVYVTTPSSPSRP